MADADQDEIVRFLKEPSSFGAGAAVSVTTTHGAYVFLSGDEAIKIKRAVAYDYMDFSTLAAREAALRRELELNHEGAPQIYRDVVPVTREPRGELALDGTGVPVEWALRMWRFPAEAELAAIAARDELTDALADDIGSIIAEYHRRAPGRSADGADLQTAILDELDAAFAGMDHDLGRKRIAAFRGKARERLAACTPVLSKRTELGHVRRCHGDLHLRNLVLIDGRPVPFDALEFDETLGTCDVLYDLAFLLMDLCYRGHPRAANIVQNSYLFAERGTQDSGLATMPLFLAVRAGIRAMVAVQTEHTASSRPSSTGTGRAYLELALTALTPPSPRLVAIGGRSGTGKTTLARQIAPDIGALPGAFHLRSDLERKALHGVNAGTRLPAEAYTEAEGQRVYTHLLARAEPVLRAGHSVLLDAVYLSPDARAEARALAERLDVPFTGIWLQADTEALIARVSARQADASDANSSCPIPDVHIDPRRSGLFMARSILREVRDGRRTC